MSAVVEPMCGVAPFTLRDSGNKTKDKKERGTRMRRNITNIVSSRGEVYSSKLLAPSPNIVCDRHYTAVQSEFYPTELA